MKKKLLFVITKAAWGGAGRYVFDLATALSEDYDVAVAMGGEGLLSEKLRTKGIRIIPLPSLTRDISQKHDVAAFFALMRLFRRERPDIVHLNSSKAGALGALAGRLSGVRRIVFTAHGWAFNEPVPPLSKAFRWTASLATVMLCHRVIAVSDFDRVHSPLGLEVEMIHNGVAPVSFLEPGEARERLLAGTGQSPAFIVGTIAELTRNKGLDTLIEAFSRTDHARLVIIGEGEERSSLERLIAAKGLAERVTLLGFVENASTLLRGFDLFALASRKEGLPYVLLEAGLAGVPVIATTVGGIPEIVDDRISGALVPPYDTEALADGLIELMGSAGTRAHHAERLKANVERYFPLYGMVKKTKEVYEKQ